MSVEEGTKGPVAAFAHFAPFKSWWAYLFEWYVLFNAPQHDQEVRDLELLHYAHFTRVPAKALKRAGVSLPKGGLLFLSAFNGGTSVYFKAFSDDVPIPMDALWQGSVGWTSAQPFAELDQFISRYRRQVTAFAHGYPAALLGVRKALALRRGIERLVEVARSNPSAFDRELDIVALSHWGDAKREAHP